VPKFAASKAKGAVVVKAKGAVDENAFVCAAQAMIAYAHVAVGRNAVWMRSKLSTNSSRNESVDTLAKKFEAAYAEQARLWRELRAMKKSREAQLAQVLSFAAPAAPSAELDFGELSAERKAEIAALLAEPPVEDVHGIRTTWMDQRTRRRAL
jgi:hypothetical protein